MTKEEMRTIATIRKKGWFTYQVIVHRENSRAQDKVYTCGKVKVDEYDGDKYILNFTPKAGSIGMTSKGSMSARAYYKIVSIVADEVRWE